MIWGRGKSNYIFMSSKIVQFNWKSSVVRRCKGMIFSILVRNYRKPILISDDRIRCLHIDWSHLGAKSPHAHEDELWTSNIHNTRPEKALLLVTVQIPNFRSYEMFHPKSSIWDLWDRNLTTCEENWRKNTFYKPWWSKCLLIVLFEDIYTFKQHRVTNQ